MQKEILDLQKRITNLEFEVSKTNRTSNSNSLPASEVESGSERRYEEAGESKVCLSKRIIVI
jgi:hypothetical protein